MIARSYSYSIFGIEAYPIEIEIDISRGLPSVNLVGMADTAIKESRERVKSAIKNSGFDWPSERITVNLAPSDLKKEGSAFDLAIALGILCAAQKINSSRLSEYIILGELALDGSIRPVHGALSAAMALLASAGAKDMIVPHQNAREAAMISGVRVWPQKTLKETVEFLNDPQNRKPYQVNLNELFSRHPGYRIDFSEIKGQYFAKRAMEVAVCGSHNILMIGPPGSGKTMLAKRIPTIMPELSLEEALEITRIHSASGMLPEKDGFIRTRPFRMPHHSISDSALIGGGSNPKPGEISLAHLGVLFMDELPEFSRNCLEALRQPLEDSHIRISRVNNSLVFPSSFMLVCAMNPCPCGYYTDPRKACKCNPNKIANYMARLSGPLMDRLDIHIELPSVKYRELSGHGESETSSAIKARVERARSIQSERLRTEGVFSNAQMSSKLIKKFCTLEEEAQKLLGMAMTELGFSARAYEKILKVARTISDLRGGVKINCEDIAEAVQYRSLDRNP